MCVIPSLIFCFNNNQTIGTFCFIQLQLKDIHHVQYNYVSCTKVFEDYRKKRVSALQCMQFMLFICRYLQIAEIFLFECLFEVKQATLFLLLSSTHSKNQINQCITLIGLNNYINDKAVIKSFIIFDEISNNEIQFFIIFQLDRKQKIFKEKKYNLL